MSEPDIRAKGTVSALVEVQAEVVAATSRYPAFNSPHEGYAVIKEELDELWDEVKHNDTGRAIEEAVQVAAMAIRFIVDMRIKADQSRSLS